MLGIVLLKMFFAMFFFANEKLIISAALKLCDVIIREDSVT